MEQLPQRRLKSKLARTAPARFRPMEHPAESFPVLTCGPVSLPCQAQDAENNRFRSSGPIVGIQFGDQKQMLQCLHVSSSACEADTEGVESISCSWDPVGAYCHGIRTAYL